MTRPAVAGRRYTLKRTSVAVALVAALASLPLFGVITDGNPYVLVFGYYLFFWVTQATSWNIFSGYAGYLNFGQNAFYGAGVYATVLCERHFHANLFLDMAAGAVAGGFIALLAGFAVFRLRAIQGEIFALFTLALGLGLGLVANNVKFIDGGAGALLDDVSFPSWLGPMTTMLYLLGLALAVISVGAAYLIKRSRLGYGLAAVRDDEPVAEAMGVPVFRYKLTVFVLSGAISGASGALDALLIFFISPNAAFGPTVPMLVIVMSFIGGRRFWYGPAVGALIIFTLSDRLTTTGMAEVNQIIMGLLLIGVVVGLRDGISSRIMRHPRRVTAAVGTVVVVGLFLGTSPIVALSFGLVAGLAASVLPSRSLPGSSELPAADGQGVPARPLEPADATSDGSRAR